MRSEVSPKTDAKGELCLDVIQIKIPTLIISNMFRSDFVWAVSFSLRMIRAFFSTFIAYNLF